jgi:hypothetical protein
MTQSSRQAWWIALRNSVPFFWEESDQMDEFCWYNDAIEVVQASLMPIFMRIK